MTEAEGKRKARFCGNSLSDLRGFPEGPRKTAGHQLNEVQCGRNPTDWRSFREIGPGVREIRIQEPEGAFRVIYVAKFEEAVYVLHCFQKKDQKTPKPDIELAKKRYQEVVQERKQ